MSILETVQSPADLRALDVPALTRLAEEIRGFLVAKVSATGGHLGPNLGVVELTLAVHRVFNSPKDPVLFDTGHQAYVHKIVTGRRDLFDTLRQRDGLSGYPARDESPHDWTESSHASASLSYADGLARAFEVTGQRDRTVVAVIGDGALTGGMVWEALNNIAEGTSRPVVVVVNDNGRSYAPTVGGLARGLAAQRAQRVRPGSPAGDRAGAGPGGGLGDRAARLLHGITGRSGTDGAPVLPQELSDDLGLSYIGPVDGHDLRSLEDALRRARDVGGPVLVHTVTEKGHGFAPAVNDPADHLHSTGSIDPVTGQRRTGAVRSWTDVFADELIRVGDEREDVVAVTAAMAGPTGLARFAGRFPDRTVDVGIAEQHAVTSAAGLALGGLHPVVAVYSTFLGRAFDQLLMDVGLLRLPVTLVLDRAGVTGPDGASHNGVWDLSVTGVVPGIRVAAPRDGAALVAALDRCLAVSDGPTVVRFPKGALPEDVPVVRTAPDYDVLVETRPEEAGQGCLRVLVVNYGSLTAQSTAAATALAAVGHRATVVDPLWVTPVADSLVDLAARSDLVVTVEDNVVHGGAGQRLHREMVAAEVDTPVRHLAVPQEYLTHGTRAEVIADAHLDEVSVARRVTGWAATVSGRAR